MPKRKWILAAAERAAALPGAEAEASATLDTDEGEGARTVNRTTGAEAGTPETTAFPDDAEWLVYLDRFVEQTNPQSLPRSIHDRLRAVAAALASEARDQTTKAQTMWEDREGWKRTASERGFEIIGLRSEVARLNAEREEWGRLAFREQDTRVAVMRDLMATSIREQAERERAGTAEAENARLTSEVRALTEQRDEALEVLSAAVTAHEHGIASKDEDDDRLFMDGGWYSSAWPLTRAHEARTTTAARLASPSPTGAE